MSAPGQKQSASKMLYMLPLMFMANKINYTDEFVNFLRLTYYTVQLGTLILAYIIIRNKVLAKNDKTKIFLPPVVNPFAPPDAPQDRPKESTYVEHELDQVGQLVRSTLIGLAMVSFLHWKMGTKPVLLLQSIMGPMNLTDNGLVKKYIMGSRDRVWGETLEGEGEETAPLRGGQQQGRLQDGKEKEGKKPESAEAKAERMEALLDKVFNKEASCAALLKACDKSTINFVSKRERYSPLTVLCSRPDVTEAEVKQALFAGANKFHKDEDGCTALHWAAMKGVVAAVSVLTAVPSGASLADVEKLLKTKDGDGKTPLALAKESVEPDHEEVEALLVAAQKKVEAALVVD